MGEAPSLPAISSSSPPCPSAPQRRPAPSHPKPPRPALLAHTPTHPPNPTPQPHRPHRHAPLWHHMRARQFRGLWRHLLRHRPVRLGPRLRLRAGRHVWLPHRQVAGGTLLRVLISLGCVDGAEGVDGRSCVTPRTAEEAAAVHWLAAVPDQELKAWGWAWGCMGRCVSPCCVLHSYHALHTSGLACPVHPCRHPPVRR